MADYFHESVMRRSLVDAIQPASGTCAIDCTLGGGGHTKGLLEKVGDQGLVIAIDRDATAIANARIRFQEELARNQLVLIQSTFSRIKSAVKQAGVTRPITAVCADIGVSSVHFDDASRGFSFAHDGPLDMRMDQSSDGETAADIVNTWTVEELTRILREYGEEPKAWAIANGIVKERANTRIETTSELSSIVERFARYSKPSRKHVATRTFQALRIAVNDELEELKKLLDDGFGVLSPKGRLAIICFHSLEDRIVKSHFVSLSDRARERQAPKGAPMTEVELHAFRKSPGTILKPFPMMASENEVQENPRARSAKLRVIEKNYLDG